MKKGQKDQEKTRKRLNQEIQRQRWQERARNAEQRETNTETRET